MDDKDALVSYGMTQLGTVRMEGPDQFIIEIADAGLAAEECCIYAFLIGGEIQRIGSSKNRLSSRMRAWSRDVSRALSGKKSPTADWEAKEWRERLKRNGFGEVWARPGTVVTTSAGTFNAYLSEESYLIGKHLPPLNRSKHR